MSKRKKSKRIISLVVLFVMIFNFNIIPTNALTGSITSESRVNYSKINNLVILIDFSDTDSLTLSQTKSTQLENVYNDFLDSNKDGVSDEDRISLKSYIYDITKGQTLVDSHIYPKSADGTTYYSYKDTNTKQYYAGTRMGSAEEKDLIRRAFNSVKNDLNLSAQDLDTNGDGYIDSATFIFSGVPNVSGDSALRAHKTEIATNQPEIDGKRLKSYYIMGEGSPRTNIFNGEVLSTVAHEFLHILSYTDLYRNPSTSHPVGVWDIMADTTLNLQIPLVYSMNKYGNTGYRIEDINSDGTFTLKNSQIANLNETVAYKVQLPENPKEYFIIEYKKNTGKWDKSLPGSGIIVYRINDNVPSNKGNSSTYGDHIYLFRPDETSANSGLGKLKEALLSHESHRVSFGTSIESNTEFDPNSIYFSNGKNSGIVISEVGSSTSDEITFKIELTTKTPPVVEPADYSKVDDAIAKANALNKNNYVDFSKVESAIANVVRGKDNTEQAIVDGYAKAIEDAINSLVLLKADYRKVDDAIAKANTLNKNNYVNFSKVESAIANIVRDKDITEQSLVDSYAVAIENAISALVFKKADYSKVDEAIAKANALNKDHYVDFSKVDAAISKVVRDKDITEQALVDSYASSINSAINSLTLNKADYSKVDDAISKAYSLNKDLYTNFNIVESAIANVVRDKNITEQAIVNGYATSIETAINNLVLKKADYSKVDEAIANANALNKDHYVDFSKVDEAIANVVRDKNITEQAIVDAYVASIETAINSLVLKKADYSKVDSAIDKANSINKSLYSNFNVVESAIANVVRDKDITEQATVDAYATSIENAINNLVLKKADYSKVNDTISKANTFNKDYYVDFSDVDEAIANIVWDKDITEQDIVDGYVTAIEAALSNLVLKKADYSKVDDAISKANSLNKDHYVDFSDVESAIANVVRDKDITEQPIVDGYVTAIETAISNLVLKKADYSKVNDAISKANSLNKDHYVDFSKVESAIANVDWNKPFTEQTTVDSYATTIESAISNLVLKKADYSKVDDAISKANALNKDLYVDFSKVESAITNVVRDKDITDQATVDAFATSIENAISNLVLKKADYSKVDEAISKANALNKDHYVDFSEVDEAIANVIRDKDINEQATIDAFATSIENAISNLVLKKADYSKVDEAISKANTLNKDLYANFSNVEFAIAAVVRNKDITEQTIVDGYAVAIEDAILNLVLKADYSKVDDAISKANALNKDLYANFGTVESAIANVDWNKDITEQAVVDGYAIAIENAILNLVLKADYSKVDAAIAKANSLNKDLYANFSEVDEAIANVVRDKDITEQATVDAYATSIETAISNLVLKKADYSKVDDSISMANALNKDHYVDFSKVDEAIANVVRDKDITEQATVDAFATAIEKAIEELEEKPPTPVIPPEISDIIDEEVLEILTGNGTVDSPLELNLKEISSDKLSLYFDTLNELRPVVWKVEKSSLFTTYFIKYTTAESLNLRSRTLNEYYTTLVIDNNYSELIALADNFAEENKETIVTPDPELPTDPEVPTEPEAPSVPEDNNSNTESDSSNNNNSDTLPQTGSRVSNSTILLFSVLLIVSGVYLSRKKKSS